jgi:hypothetical protein
VWEMIYNHYAKRKGLSVPGIAAYAAQHRPEGGGGNYGTTSGGFDQLGFGTLTFTRDPLTAARAVSATVDEQWLQSNYSLYPNPCYNAVTVAINKLPAKPVAMSLQDVHGRVLQKVQCTGSKHVFNLQGLAKGVYWLHIRDEQQVITRQFMKDYYDTYALL